MSSRSTHRLTVVEAKRVTEPGRYADGGTLFLVVAPGGSKSWVQRLMVNGRRRDIGLGGFPLVRLAEAREKAVENRRVARSGGDPLAERKKGMSFREASEKTFEAIQPRWKSAKVASNWQQQLERHAFQRLADLPVNEVGREDVLAVLLPIWNSKPETARRVRRCIKDVLGWCQAHGIIEHNVAGEAINGALSSRPAKQHMRALDYREVPEALRIVEASGASPAVKLCFRFLVLTAARSGEARGATWSEIDVEHRLWTLPASRMKANVEHRQALNEPAIAVLEQARGLQGGGDLIFPSPAKRGKPLSDMALTKLLRSNGLADRTVIHGFRSAFRTWAEEATEADHAVKELSLAHAVGSQVERAYARSDLLAKRRELMRQWGDFVTGADATS